jgi:50S ribosomal protein L16 3-hydroxylase
MHVTTYNPAMRLPLLAGLTPRQFLSRHWQKKPLLIRQAIPGFSGPLTRAAMLRLAASADLETRLVSRQDGRWDLTHGPITRSMLAALPARNWTLLVQGLNHVDADADALLRRFDFIPRARQDDVMVSYAVPGGGVGPHLDSYDVFLLQGAGRRRWRIGMQTAGLQNGGIQDAAAFKPGLPLKILQRFKPQHEWVLEPGDMLYLPPGYAHEGTALTECFTYSIGFRAPSHNELRVGFLDYLHDMLPSRDTGGMLRDPGLRPALKPGALPPAMLTQAQKVLRELQWDKALVADFLARSLSEPKPHIVFSPPARPLGEAAFAAALKRHGAALDAKSLMVYDGARIYLNGEEVPVPAGAAGKNVTGALKQLADRRSIVAGKTFAPALGRLLRSWYVYGFVHVDGKWHP